MAQPLGAPGESWRTVYAASPSLQVLARCFRPWAVSVFLLSLLAARGADAQDDCEPVGARGPIEVMPASGANGVLLDAPLRLRFTVGYFASAAAPLPEESLEILGPDGLPVAGSVQLVSEEVLFFLPTGGWQSGAAYTGTAFGEVDLPFAFRTGSGVDMRAPTVAPLSSLGSTPVGPSCQAPEGGYRLDLAFPVSHDDGTPGSIEYHLYLARAEGLEAPVEVAVQRNFTADASARVPISFVLEGRYAESPICLQLQVSDSVGNVTVGSPYCLDPVEGANFAGLCTVGGPSSRSRPGAPLTAWTIVALGLALRRRTRATRSPSSAAAARS
ncbi:MAG: hypothetical protein R3B40_17785 [Polyangiales bacterium]|nr:hypothetical protein [Myxococcales bacterium]